MISAPPKSGGESFEIGVAVNCPPEKGRLYLLAIQLENQGKHGTLNTYPKKVFTSSFKYRLNLPPAQRFFLVYDIPAGMEKDLTAMIDGNLYYYDPGFEPPRGFEVAADRVSVTP